MVYYLSEQPVATRENRVGLTLRNFEEKWLEEPLDGSVLGKLD